MRVIDVAREINDRIENNEGVINEFGKPLEISDNKFVSQCASFFRYCFQKAHGTERFFELIKNKEPRASTVFHAIKEHAIINSQDSKNFADTPKVGDIFVIKYTEIRENGFSGHVGIIEKVDKIDDETFLLKLIDSTNSHHGAGDSRFSKPGGIGTGFVELNLRKKSNEIRYKWKGQEHFWDGNLCGADIQLLIAQID